MTTRTERKGLRIPWWLGVCLLAAIAVFLLWEEHKVHILGALPYLILLACPLIHLLMHGRHGHGGHDGHGGHGGHDGHDGHGGHDGHDDDHAHHHGGAS